MFSKRFYCSVIRNIFPFHMRMRPVTRAPGNALDHPPRLSQTRTVFSAVDAPIEPNMNAWMFVVCELLRVQPY